MTETADHLPPEQQRNQRRASKLSWLSVAFLISTAIVIYLTLGQSEAMKTAWVEDIMGLVPPLVLIVALRLENRPPTKRFPFGYFRAVSIAFLVTSSILTLVGAWLLLDAALKLMHGERPPIGTQDLMGHTVWAGWAMVAALAYCMGVGILLGRLKQPVAEKLNDKALAADADMNKAGWMSEGAAIIGILLIGHGQWWGDAAAAAFISLNIIRDGWVNLRQVVADVMDEAPTKMGGMELDEIPARLRRLAESRPWVRKAGVRLREHGHLIMGEVFVVTDDASGMVERIEGLAKELTASDWRLYGLTVMPVTSIGDRAVPESPAAPTATGT